MWIVAFLLIAQTQPKMGWGECRSGGQNVLWDLQSILVLKGNEISVPRHCRGIDGLRIQATGKSNFADRLIKPSGVRKEEHVVVVGVRIVRVDFESVPERAFRLGEVPVINIVEHPQLG